MSHLGKALKKKITDKVGGAMGAVLAAPHNAESRRANSRYQVAKKYNDMKASGVSDPKTTAQMHMVRDYYAKK